MIQKMVGVLRLMRKMSTSCWRLKNPLLMLLEHRRRELIWRMYLGKTFVFVSLFLHCLFRFDSEMQDVDEGEEEKDSETKKSVSVDDLNDALMEETTDESEAEGAAASDIPTKEGDEAGVDIAGQWATLILLLSSNLPKSIAKLNLALFKELIKN